MRMRWQRRWAGYLLVMELSHSGGAHSTVATPPHQEETAKAVNSWVRCSDPARPTGRRRWRDYTYRLA